ncbi:uncharacterized protein LOC116172004 [Photinus pyralis]|uniref:uncharacterized protein LOC116172004 n=1 Tax=Photinus pyralis TaxID=7054 RepID=UPI0012675FEB|nr:uncharacterized protein LOC116172004 [Photinus pyralis]
MVFRQDAKRVPHYKYHFIASFVLNVCTSSKMTSTPTRTNISKCEWLLNEIREYVPNGYTIMYPCAHNLVYDERRDILLFIDPFFGDYYIWVFTNSEPSGRGVAFVRVGPRYQSPRQRNCYNQKR